MLKPVEAAHLKSNAHADAPDPDELVKVYRHELKYYINHTEYKVLSDILEGHMELDPHADESKDYWIRSLYFDTPDNRDFNEKEAGYSIRKKIRLRLYDVNQEKIKLEVKRKNEQFMLKETASLSREHAAAMIAGDKDALLINPNPTKAAVYYLMSCDLYRPVIVVDYMREAYILPFQHIRVTFDKCIQANNYHFDIFDPHLVTHPVFEETTIVLEVKFHRFLPDWLMEIFSGFQANRAAVSKYAFGRYLL